MYTHFFSSSLSFAVTVTVFSQISGMSPRWGYVAVSSSRHIQSEHRTLKDNREGHPKAGCLSGGQIVDIIG